MKRMTHEILNFDTIIGKLVKKQHKYLENDFLLPPNPFRSIIVGPSGCGKSNLLFNLLLKHLKYHKVIVVARYLEEDKYEFLREFFKRIADETKQKFSDIYEEYDDLLKVPDPKEEKSPGTTKVIIFDDWVSESEAVQKIILNYYIFGRKQGFTCFYLSQSFTGVPVKIRSNADFMLIYRQNSTDVQSIYNAVGKGFFKDSKEFHEFFDAVTSDDHSFLTIWLTCDPKIALRKNLNEFISYRE